MMKLFQKFPSNYKYWIGPFLCFSVREPEDVQIILNSENAMKKPSFLEMYTKHSLLVLNGDKYKLHRKTVVPVFKTSSLRSYLPTINERIDNFLERFDSKLKTEAFDMSIYAKEFTVDATLCSIFDYTDSFEEERIENIEKVHA
jgi:cytochrome P450